LKIMVVITVYHHYLHGRIGQVLRQAQAAKAAAHYHYPRLRRDWKVRIHRKSKRWQLTATFTLP
jgi:hypothetical protein